MNNIFKRKQILNNVNSLRLNEKSQDNNVTVKNIFYY